MPAFTFNADTEKEATIKGHHTKWKELKTTHQVVLKTNSISFNDNLGKALDNRWTYWKAIHEAKAHLNVADKSQLAAFRTKLNTLKSNAKTGQQTVAAYHKQIQKLNVAATKPQFQVFDQALVQMDKAFQYDINYAESI